MTTVAPVARKLVCVFFGVAVLVAACGLTVAFRLPAPQGPIVALATFCAMILCGVPAFFMADRVGKAITAERQTRIQSESRHAVVSIEKTYSCPRCSHVLNPVTLSERQPDTLDRETLPGRHFECPACRRWFRIETFYRLDDVLARG